MKVPEFHQLKRGSSRRPRLDVRYTHERVRYVEPTGARTRAEYDAYCAQLRRRFELGTWAPPAAARGGGDSESDGRTLFKTWAPRAIAKRAALGVSTALTHELSIVDNHLLPEFGDEPLEALRSFVRVAKGFESIAKKDIGGATVRNIHHVFYAVMRLAAKAGLIDSPPARLSERDGELPPLIERRPPGWRAAAQFTREEIALLVQCEPIEPQYRVMYVTYFLTGSRFAEVQTLHVRDLDLASVPLASLTIHAVKQRGAKRAQDMVRILPVHPALRAWLSWWLRDGFEHVHTRKPGPDDLLFPAFTVRRLKSARRAGIDPREQPCSHAEVYSRWKERHLPAAGLRHRRLHDARRTFLSILRSSGASKDIARSFTHRAIADRVLDAYTTFEWEALCRELGKVDWRIPGPPSSMAAVIELRPRGAKVGSTSGSGSDPNA